MVTTDQQFWWNWFAQVAIAIATFLAVLAALFLDWFRGRFFPPQLELTLLDAAGAPVVPTVAHKPTKRPDEFEQIETVSRWYHVQVRNKRRFARARDAQVCLVAVEEQNAAGEYVPRTTGAIPLAPRHAGVAAPSRVLGSPIQWDLCALYRDLGEGPVFRLTTVIAPADITVVSRQAFKMVVHLQARTIEVDTKVLRLELSWNGKWSDDTSEMKNHFVIRAL